MPLLRRSGRSALGRAVGTAYRGARLLVRGTVNGGRWTTRGIGRLRAKGAGGETGMIRLFDLHAASCAGDTLVTIGLAGTIFFSVPLGEARSKVALYLLITMVPFALLAPVIGPLLDHFRHGRRYALALTMLGRAFLAWLISDHLHGFALYPAAFGVLALSRTYGVARSAAVPRLLPEGIGLSQAGARASVYGTLAGAAMAPLGLAAVWLGPQWPLRVASGIFLIGMVIALRLPPRADSDPPQPMPRSLRTVLFKRDRNDRALGRGEPAGTLVIATLIGSGVLRGLYGFLLLFLAFAIKAGDLTTGLLGRELTGQAALGLIGGALVTGTFLATALGTRLRIRHPTVLQAAGLVIVATVAALATLRFSLLLVALLCLVTAIVSGIAKLAVDASIQERIRERLRASAFAHSETALMLAFVAGGALGLIPLDGRVGIGALAAVSAVGAVRAVIVAGKLRGETLRGRASDDPEQSETGPTETGPTETGPTETGPTETGPTDTGPTDTGPTDTAAPTANAPVVEKTTTAPATTGPVDVRKPIPAPAADEPADDGLLAPPGYHIYRPSSAVPNAGSDSGASQDR